MELLKLISGSQILAHIISFLVLLFLLRKFAWGKILKFLDERKERIALQLNEIEERKGELAQLKSGYEAKLNTIEESARAKINEAILEGQRIARQIKDDAHNEAQRIINDAKSCINEEFLKAKEELKNSIVALAMAAASHIIETRITESDSRRLVQDFLQNIEAIDEKKDISG